MTTIIYNHKNENHELIIKGHAGYAEAGEDIVCAAISILTYTLVEAIDENTLKSPPTVVLNSGDTLIRVKPKNEKEAEICGIFSVVCAGFNILSKNFPENVIFFRGEG